MQSEQWIMQEVLIQAIVDELCLLLGDDLNLLLDGDETIPKDWYPLTQIEEDRMNTHVYTRQKKQTVEHMLYWMFVKLDTCFIELNRQFEVGDSLESLQEIYKFMIFKLRDTPPKKPLTIPPWRLLDPFYDVLEECMKTSVLYDDVSQRWKTGTVKKVKPEEMESSAAIMLKSLTTLYDECKEFLNIVQANFVGVDLQKVAKWPLHNVRVK
jgi:hypothetical protein